VGDREARREERKARAADRVASGQVGPPIAEPLPPPGEEVLPPPAPEAPRERQPLGGNRLYVGNLSFDTDENALRDVFAEHGEVTDVHVMTDRDTGRPRGFAFVTMKSAADAQKAMRSLDGAVVDNRPLRVNEAEDRPRGGGGGGRRR
jgi:RNA recognition motif-containing protein